MTIDRLGPIDPLQNLNKAEKSERPRRVAGADSIDFSAEAKSKGELYRASELAKSTPDIRADRVEEVKRKLQDPNYISDKLVDELADRLMDLFGLTSG
jgi:negative regulator of flagellin synthesis FlgM